MSSTPPIPSDVLMFLAELDQFITPLIEKYYDASEKDTTATKHFQHFAPIDVQVHSVDGLLATFTEEGINLYPEGN